MQKTDEITAGTPVVIKTGDPAGRIGLKSGPASVKFRLETVGNGHAGEYVGPDPVVTEPDWHLVRVDVDGKKLYAPVHRSQFAVVKGKPTLAEKEAYGTAMGLGTKIHQALSPELKVAYNEMVRATIAEAELRSVREAVPALHNLIVELAPLAEQVDQLVNEYNAATSAHPAESESFVETFTRADEYNRKLAALAVAMAGAINRADDDA